MKEIVPTVILLLLTQCLSYAQALEERYRINSYHEYRKQAPKTLKSKSFFRTRRTYGGTFKDYPLRRAPEDPEPPVAAPTPSQNSVCNIDADCDDHNPCTIDTCITSIDQCLNEETSIFSPECRSFGSPKALVLRVIADDASTTPTKSQLKSNIFGINTSGPNLKSQLSKCSYNKFNFLPYHGTTTTNEQVTDGVSTINILRNVIGAQAEDIVPHVIDSATTKFGDLQSQFDFILVCLPPGTLIGTSSNWRGYARVDSYLTVYNDENCNYLSVLMHEIGHNFGLSHSNDEQNYGDESGMMGISYGIIAGPLKCYDAPKSWQLMWYSESHMVIDLQQIPSTTTELYDLVGFSDFDSRGSKYTIIKLVNSKNSYDYYISFNRKNKFNQGTQEGEDQVLVSRAFTGYAYYDSFLVARLSEYDDYHIFSASVRENVVFEVKVSTMNLLAAPAFASIFIKRVISRDLAQIVYHFSSACTWANYFDKCHLCGAKAIVEIITNDAPEQLNWELIRMDTQEVSLNSGLYTQPNAPYSDFKCIEYGKYKFSLVYTEEISTLPVHYSLKIGDTSIDSDVLNNLTFVENIFVLCETDTDCNDYDGCTVDLCNEQTHLCENSRVNDEANCVNCEWFTLTLNLDNFPDETTWGLYTPNEAEVNFADIVSNFLTAGIYGARNDNPSLILAGNPDPIYVSGFGRSKAPTKAGRSKAPTRVHTKTRESKLHERQRKKSSLRSTSDQKSTTQMRFLNTGPIVERICLEKSYSYIFVINDSFGDGICCTEGYGNFQVELNNNILLQGGNFEFSETVKFSLQGCSSNADCDDNDGCTDDVCLAGLSTCVHNTLPCENCGSEVKIRILTDWTPVGLRWQVTDSSTSKVVTSGGPYQTSCAVYEVSQCMPYGTFTFSISDLTQIQREHASCGQIAGYELTADSTILTQGELQSSGNSIFTISPSNPNMRANYVTTN